MAYTLRVPIRLDKRPQLVKSFDFAASYCIIVIGGTWKMTRLRLYALGPPRVECNDQPIDIARRKAVALLIYLAVTGQSHSRDTLATLFWPEYDQSRARAGLRRALAALKKALGEGRLEIDRETIGLNPDADIWVDVGRFHCLLAECRAHDHPERETCPDCVPLLTEAAALCGDDFMAGFTLRDSPAFDDWQFFQTQGLRDELASALERLARGHSAQGQFEQAIAHARRRLALDPLHEPAHRHLMQLYAWAGQRAAALRQYQECARVLEEELAVPPEEETTQLYEDIKQKRESPPLVEPRVQPLIGKKEEEEEEGEERQRVVNAPPQAVSDLFRDRVTEMAALTNHIGGETARLISVVGRAGMGKTALACKVLDDLAKNRHPDAPPIKGLIYLTVSELSLDRLVHDVGEMLGQPARSQLAQRWAAPEEELATKIDAVLAALREEERYVILLDNLEDLLDAKGRLPDSDLACFVDRCLHSQSGVRLVVTSRERPYVSPEGRRRAPRVILDEGLPLDEAREMLRDLDPDGELGLRDASQSDLEQAARLARRMPRALELLAFVLHQAEGTLSLDHLLEDEALFLDDALVVERLAAEVYRRLDDDERRVVDALAVLEEPATAQAVEYLLTPWQPHLDVTAALRWLIRGHFVSYNRMTSGGGRYALHPVDRAFALRLIAGEDEGVDGATIYTRTALEDRAAAYYRGLRKPEAEWRSIDDLQPQLREYEHLLRAGQANEACELLNNIDQDFLQLWGYARLVVRMRERLFSRLKSLHLKAVNHHSLGDAYRNLGRAREAAAQYEDALATAREIGEKETEGAALGGLGRANWMLGQVEKATGYLKEALTIAREIGDRRSEGMHVRSLGRIYCDLGQMEKATSHLADALIIAREIGDKRGQSQTLAFLGRVHYDLGQVEVAIGYCESALTIAREIGDKHGEGAYLNSLGNFCYEFGQLEKAFGYYESALAIAREIGDKRREAQCAGNLGNVCSDMGQMEKAFDHYEESLSIAREVGDKRTEGLVLGILGHASTALKRHADAVAYLREGINILTEINLPLGQCWLNGYLGWALLASGRLDEAQSAFGEAAVMDVPDGNYLASVGLGVTCLRLDDETTARKAFSEAVERCEALLAKTPELREACFALGLARSGLAVLGAGAMEEAIAAYKRARDICDARGVLDEERRKLDELEEAGYGDLSKVRAALTGVE